MSNAEKATLTLRLDSELAGRLAQAAGRLHRSVNNLVTVVLARWLEEVYDRKPSLTEAEQRWQDEFRRLIQQLISHPEVREDEVIERLAVWWSEQEQAAGRS